MNNYISKEQLMVIGANNTYNSFLTNPIMNFDSIKKLLDDHVLSEASKFISEVKTSTKLFRSRIVDFSQDADV